MEFTPSPFSFLFSPFLVQSVWLFPLFHFLSSCFWGGCFSHILPPPSSSSLRRQKQLPALRGFSLPSSPLCAEYLLSSVVQVVQIVVLILKSVF